MLDIEQIKNKLSDRNLNAVARATGLAYDTVWRVAKGRYTKPSYDTLKRISDYLESK